MKKFCLTSLAFCLSAASIFAAESEQDSTIWRTSDLDELVVTGVRGGVDPRLSPFTVSQIQRSDIEERLSSSLLDVISEQVPGVFTTSRGMLGYGVSTGAAGQMNIRGIGNAPTTGVMVLIDGHPQQMGIMGHPISDAYQSMIAEKIEVVRGPSSMLYGSAAMGGVINIVTRKMRQNGVKHELNLSGGSYGTFTSDYTMRLRRNRFSAIGAISYNRTDGHRANSAFEQMSGYAKLGYELSDHWNVFADLNLTHFNASNPGSEESPMIDNDQHITRGMASLNVSNDYASTSGGLSLFHNWGRHKINDGYTLGGTPKDYLFRSHDYISGLCAYQSFSLFSGNRTTFGADAQLIGGKAWNDYTTSATQLVDTTLTEVAVYADFRQQMAQWLTAEIGLRVDHHSVAGTELVPQMGLSAHFDESHIDAKFTVGKGFRNPTLMNLFMFRPRNPDLRAERLWNYEAAFSQQLVGGRIQYGVNIYYMKGDNIIQTVGGHNENSGEIENFGIELQGKYLISEHWNVGANYSFIHAVHRVVATPKHRLFGQATYSCRRISVTASLDWMNHLTTQVSPYTQSSYVLLNARVQYAASSLVTLFAKGENLLAQKYEINSGFPMPRATFMGGVRLRL